MQKLELHHYEFDGLAEEVLGQGGKLSFVARGFSMYPFIPDGTVLTVGSVDVSSLRVGHIVLYRREDRLAVHRITDRVTQDREKGFLVRGDAFVGLPEYVSAHEILGLVNNARVGRLNMPVSRNHWRLAGLIWTRLSPLGPIILRTALRTLARIRSY